MILGENVKKKENMTKNNNSKNPEDNAIPMTLTSTAQRSNSYINEPFKECEASDSETSKRKDKTGKDNHAFDDVSLGKSILQYWFYVISIRILAAN